MCKCMCYDHKASKNERNKDTERPKKKGIRSQNDEKTEKIVRHRNEQAQRKTQRASKAKQSKKKHTVEAS